MKFPLKKTGDYYERRSGPLGLYCPKCGATSWLLGPRGGASINIQCIACHSYFNDMAFGMHELDDRSEVWGIKKGS